MKTVKYVKDCITMIKELDGVEITIVPGTVGKVNADSTLENEWKWAVEGLKECYAHGLKSGVKLAIEPLNRFETYFISSAIRHYFGRSRYPECGVCLDAFHLNIERPTCWQPSAGLASDPLTSTLPTTIVWLVAWARSTGLPSSARSRIGYDGVVTVEFVAPVDRTPANPFPMRKEPSQHQPRTAQVYRRSRLQPAQRRILRLAGRTLRTGSTAVGEGLRVNQEMGR